MSALLPSVMIASWKAMASSRSGCTELPWSGTGLIRVWRVGTPESARRRAPKRLILYGFGRAAREKSQHLGRERPAPDGSLGRPHGPHAALRGLDGELAAAQQAMVHLEARRSPRRNARLDDDAVAEGGRLSEAGSDVDDRDAENLEAREQGCLGQPRGLEERSRRVVEPLEVPREVHDSGGVAVAPLHDEGSRMGQHRVKWAVRETTMRVYILPAGCTSSEELR